MTDGPHTNWALVRGGDIPDALDHLGDLLRPMDRPTPKMTTCVHVEVALRDLANRIRRERESSGPGERSGDR